MEAGEGEERGERMSLSEFRVVSSAEAVTYNFPTLAMKVVVLATAEDSDGEWSVIESIHEPGSGAPKHIHHQQHETAYVVEGEFLIWTEGRPVLRARPGAYAHFPKGLAHAFKCVGTTTGKLLFWMTPGGYERFFAEAIQVIGPGAPDMGAIAALGKKHDVDIVGGFIEEDA